MRLVIQRVSQASVEIEGKTAGSISQGLMVLLGFEEEDSEEDLVWASRKLLNMRIFDDENGVMNRSILDINGALLLVSQFTLHASTKKGNRPSYIKAAKPDIAVPLYEKFIAICSSEVEVQTGEFGADMQVTLTNDGPVTIWLDSKNKE